jgi:hypothetical protein
VGDTTAGIAVRRAPLAIEQRNQIHPRRGSSAALASPVLGGISGQGRRNGSVHLRVLQCVIAQIIRMRPKQLPGRMSKIDREWRIDDLYGR